MGKGDNRGSHWGLGKSKNNYVSEFNKHFHSKDN